MLIKKLPGVDNQGRRLDPQGGAPVDHAGSQILASPNPAEQAAPTDRLDALRQALGGTGLPRGTILQDRYEIEHVLGVGGMSTVYRARDLRFSNVIRYCAVKEMPDTAPDARTGALRFANFEREASMLATLNHAAIPKIFDYFTHEGRIYLVIEYVAGQDLETRLEQAGRALPEDQVLNWAVQLCDVLSYLHGNRPEPIVFRDLKPSNIMVDSAGERVTLVDFGIAKTLQIKERGTMIGTEGYSPPEQYRGLAEPRGDIYALGATLHHLLTNSDPRLETPFTFHERPLRALNPTVSLDTERLVTHALEYDSARRWESVEAMKAAILRARRALDPTAPGADPAYPAAGGYSPAPPSAYPTAWPSVAAPVPLASAAPPAASGEPVTTQLWVFAAEDEIRSSPALCKGVVFVGSYDSNLYAVNARTGAFIWKRPTDSGIASSPLVWEDTVYVGSEDSKVYALDARRGTVTWAYPTGGPVRSSPRVLDDRILVGSDDQYFYCLDAHSGRLVWKYRGWGPVRSSAATGGDMVYVGCSDGNLYALEAASGMMKWKFHAAAPITSSPAVHEGLVYVGCADRHLYALDGDTGRAAWRLQTEHYVISSPAVGGGLVCVGSVDGNLYALDAQSGRLAWKYDTGSQVTSSPRLAGGLVYFGGIDTHVYCLGLRQGDLRWRFATRGPVTSTPLVDEGVVYVGSLDHKLYALAA